MNRRFSRPYNQQKERERAAEKLNQQLHLPRRSPSIVYFFTPDPSPQLERYDGRSSSSQSCSSLIFARSIDDDDDVRRISACICVSMDFFFRWSKKYFYLDLFILFPSAFVNLFLSCTRETFSTWDLRDLCGIEMGTKESERGQKRCENRRRIVVARENLLTRDSRSCYHYFLTSFCCN